MCHFLTSLHTLSHIHVVRALIGLHFFYIVLQTIKCSLSNTTVSISYSSWTSGYYFISHCALVFRVARHYSENTHINDLLQSSLLWFGTSKCYKVYKASPCGTKMAQLFSWTNHNLSPQRCQARTQEPYVLRTSAFRRRCRLFWIAPWSGHCAEKKTLPRRNVNTTKTWSFAQQGLKAVSRGKE